MPSIHGKSAVDTRRTMALTKRVACLLTIGGLVATCSGRPDLSNLTLASPAPLGELPTEIFPASHQGQAKPTGATWTPSDITLQPAQHDVRAVASTNSEQRLAVRERGCCLSNEKQYLQRLNEFVEAGHTEHAFSWSKSRAMQAQYDAIDMSADIAWIRQTPWPKCAVVPREAALAFLTAMIRAQRLYVMHSSADEAIEAYLNSAEEYYQVFVAEIRVLGEASP